MSIYQTLCDFALQDSLDDWVVIRVQVVPLHIKDDFPFLPSMEESGQYRAVVFVREGSLKVGQEYQNPLLILSGKEFDDIHFLDLIGRLTEEIW